MNHIAVSDPCFASRKAEERNEIPEEVRVERNCVQRPMGEGGRPQSLIDLSASALGLSPTSASIKAHNLEATFLA